MAMLADDVVKLIESGIPDSRVEIEDLRGDGDHYAVCVTSPAFEGKSRIEQHKMVQAAMGGMLGNELHALAIQTKTE